MYLVKIKNISCVIIAKDAQRTIEETLHSLKSFTEVILYLNNSTDKTKEIAQRFENVKIIEGDFLGFGPTKNKACEYASNDWILSLDSDEVLTQKLCNEIKTLDLSNRLRVFQIKRDNYFLGKKIKYSGWGKDFLVRLFNKRTHQFNDNQVHEFIELHTSTQAQSLSYSFKHNAVLDINDFPLKMVTYADLSSKKNCSFVLAILKGIMAFLKTYILQKGFLDGWRGFFIAASNGYSKFFRYTKQYIRCKELN